MSLTPQCPEHLHEAQRQGLLNDERARHVIVIPRSSLFSHNGELKDIDIGQDLSLEKYHNYHL